MEGVTVYISDFKRSLVDKLSKDFFTEPSQVAALMVLWQLYALASVCLCAGFRHQQSLLADHVQASVTCAATGPVHIKDISRIRGSQGGEVFSESKGLNFFQNKARGMS